MTGHQSIRQCPNRRDVLPAKHRIEEARGVWIFKESGFDRRLTTKYRAAYHEYRVHALRVILQEHEGSGQRLDARVLRNARGTREQFRTRIVGRFRRRKAADHFIADLVLDVVRRAKIVRISTALGPCPLDGIGAPVEAEDQPRFTIPG
ncbi:hypothetical protein [Paraburkholderia aspalathi]|uniref:hypothetical protein n=1 Tax=Paraburkholderia aspalathi TaxID=1324617 RepID=UPI0038BD635B